jgi:hypothetical protein
MTTVITLLKFVHTTTGHFNIQNITVCFVNTDFYIVIYSVNKHNIYW